MTDRRTTAVALHSMALVLWLIGGCALGEAEEGTRFGPIVRASSPGEDINQVWAYADPIDGQHLMACGAFAYPQLNLPYGYVYSSSDAGSTWHRTLVDDASTFVSEESCTYSEDGQAYFVDGDSDTTTGEPRHEWGHLQLFASGDHGMSWKRAGARLQGWVDWTFLAALPADRDHASSLAVFGNAATDRLGHWWKHR